MKTKEELEQIKEEYSELNKKLAELSEDKLDNVVGGVRPEYTRNTLTASSENVQTAESTFRDVDMSIKPTLFSKDTILEQTQKSMLSQINQSSQGMLNLLQ